MSFERTSFITGVIRRDWFMFGLIIIIMMVLFVWWCIKWWISAGVSAGNSVYNSISGANNMVTKSYITQFEKNNYSYSTIEKIEHELKFVKFPVVAAGNDTTIPTYTKELLADGNYRIDITTTNKAHNSIKFLCCGEYSMFK